MKYAYYPGCSLQESAKEYDASTRSVMDELHMEIMDIPGWTCCGASTMESVDKDVALALGARNLALAEKHLPGADILVPCSACYLNLYKAARELSLHMDKRARVNEILGREGLEVNRPPKVRHILDVLVNDIEEKVLRALVVRDLSDLNLAAYSGCQILRPFPVFDDAEHPRAMKGLLQALGAKTIEWSQGNKCCGASLMVTRPEVALESVRTILSGADEADAVVTVCPLCQMNLEMYQAKAGVKKPVVYLTQLLGLALGLSGQRMMLSSNVTLNREIMGRLIGEAATA